LISTRSANFRRSELHITHELRMRVQALEQLIKSGLTLDSDQATFMATETVHQATRAAQSGSQDATNALAQLTRSSIGSGIGGMSSEAQNSLLMDVLQQVSWIVATARQQADEAAFWPGKSKRGGGDCRRAGRWSRRLVDCPTSIH
jgi:hypothetical protein